MPGRKTYERDVFISYCNCNEPVAARLASRIERTGKQVWFAPADVDLGDSFVAKIEEALRSTRVLVLLLSEASLNSYWVHKEWRARLVQMKNETNAKLVPVLLRGVQDDQIPYLLADQNFLDWREADLENPVDFMVQCDRLLRSLAEERALQEPVFLPHVTIAMTRSEAEELASGAAFRSTPGDEEKFRQFVAEMQSYKVNFSLEPYADDRDGWRPPHCPRQTIVEALNEEIKRVNLTRRKQQLRPLQALSFTQDLFSQDDDWRNQISYHLPFAGCLVLVDAFSLFHPGVRSGLAAAAWGNQPRLAILVVPPLLPDALSVERLFVTDWKREMGPAFWRFSRELDPLCEFGLGGSHTVRRWLSYAVGKMAEIRSVDLPSGDQLEEMYDGAGPTTGIFGQMWKGRGQK